MVNYQLYDFVGKQFPTASLEYTTVLACQHFLEPNARMLKQFFNYGLKNMYVIGKSYSFNDEIAQELEDTGAQIHRYQYQSHQSFDSQFQDAIHDLLNNIPLADAPRLLVIDDGGMLLHAMKSYAHTKRIVGVEQTSSGYNLLRQEVLGFPIVNVARSRTKLDIESPFVTAYSLEQLATELQDLNVSPKRVLVIGAGAIGTEVQKLVQGQVTVYDQAVHSRQYFTDMISHQDLIIGCTGNTSIPAKYHGLLQPETVLCSMSSSDREFDAVYLRKQVSEGHNPHATTTARGIYLLNQGFPITFKGRRFEGDPNHMQLTHALMLAGALQAMQEEGKGFVDLHATVQQLIVEEWTKVYGRR